MKFTIKSYDVKKQADDIINYSNDFNEQIKKFEYLIDNINTAWNGADALKYVNLMRERYIMKMSKIQEIILDYGNYLKSVPDSYSKVDESFSNRNINV